MNQLTIQILKIMKKSRNRFFSLEQVEISHKNIGLMYQKSILNVSIFLN